MVRDSPGGTKPGGGAGSSVLPGGISRGPGMLVGASAALASAAFPGLATVSAGARPGSTGFLGSGVASGHGSTPRFDGTTAAGAAASEVARGAGVAGAAGAATSGA